MIVLIRTTQARVQGVINNIRHVETTLGKQQKRKIRILLKYCFINEQEHFIRFKTRNAQGNKFSRYTALLVFFI
jgi:hypothetical protein